MKRTMIAPLGIGVIVLVTGQTNAQTKAHAGFEKLKSLVGVWEGTKGIHNVKKNSW